jgi:Flp pilus assembly protein TadG
MRRRGERGSTMVEFTLVGFPLIFILISIFEMARGMWNYHTLEEAVEVGTRYMAVHGSDLQAESACTSNENTCGASLNGVATALANAAVGLPSSAWNVTLTAGSASHSCSPLSSCVGVTTTWPPSGNNTPGTAIEISATYTFTNSLFYFFPSQSSFVFGSYTFAAESQQTILF